MYKLKYIAVFALLVIVVMITAFVPPTGFGQNSEGSDGLRLNCEDPPCDAVARGRKAFLDRKLNGLGGNGRSCADCHMPRSTSNSLRPPPKPGSMLFRREGSAIRTLTIHCSVQSTPTTSGSTAATQLITQI